MKRSLVISFVVPTIGYYHIISEMQSSSISNWKFSVQHSNPFWHEFLNLSKYPDYKWYLILKSSAVQNNHSSWRLTERFLGAPHLFFQMDNSSNPGMLSQSQNDTSEINNANKITEHETEGMMIDNKKLLSFDECWKIRVPNFCEENVWHMLTLLRTKLHGNETVKVNVLFITNPERCVPFNHQRASQFSSSRICYWDYHVIMVIKNWVYDIDSTLPFPIRLNEYVNRSLSAKYRYFFRLVSMNEMFSYFSSDRRHMPPSHGNKNKRINATSINQKHMLPFFLDVPGLNKRSDHHTIHDKEREDVMKSLRGRHIGVLLDGIAGLKRHFRIV